MIGILLVTHGDLANELINSVAMIMGRVPLLSAVGLNNDQSLDDFKTEIEKKWRELEDKGATKILILVDMFGGSCSNVAARLASDKEAGRVALVTGVNLPMVLEAAIDRDLYSLEELVEKTVDAGKKSVVDVRAVLAQKLR
ncbi:MAG: PTS sugar transporter subunit IIA [Candidatus Zixiibacteriota bacterium]|jgi:PTS system mannose-specific IIA component